MVQKKGREPKTARGRAISRGLRGKVPKRGTPEAKASVAKAARASADKKKREKLAEQIHVYGQMVANVPAHKITKRDGSPVGYQYRWASMRAIEPMVKDLTTEENMAVAIEASKSLIAGYNGRLDVFTKDEELSEVRQTTGGEGGGSQMVSQAKRPNRNAEIGLRKLLQEESHHLHELMGLMEVHKSKNQIVLDVSGVLLIHSIMMTLVAEFVPKTEEQMAFRRRLSEILRSLGDGKLARNPRLEEGLGPEAALIDVKALAEEP